jgi:glycosyltransferase involved in cell wall biosynthesis
VSLWSHALAGVAGRALGCPVVWHFQDLIDPAAGLGLYRRLLLGWAARWPSRILCVSEAVAAQFRASPPAWARTQVLWNTVDLARFTPRSDSADLGRAGCPLIIGTAARLTPWKGQEVALRTARLLKAQGVPFHWYFAGSEDLGSRGYQQYLAGLTRQWDLETEVTWLGWVGDMPTFYQQLDVLVHLPVEPDPWGLILTEAMAAGLLIIAAASGAAQQLVPAAGGELVPPNAPEAAAAQLVAAARNHPLTRARGRRARCYAESTFSVERYTEQLVQVYQALGINHEHPTASPTLVGDRAGR